MDNQEFSQHQTIARGETVTDGEGAAMQVISIEGMAAQAVVRLQSSQGRQLLLPCNLLNRHADASWHVPFAFAALSENMNAQSMNGAHEKIVIPVIEEQAQVTKRRVQTGRGVRVHKTVGEREEVVEMPLQQDAIEVRHVPIGTVVDGAHLPQARQQGQTLIVPVLQEVLVVEKQWQLKEEIHITRHSEQVNARQTVTLRTEQARVEQFDESRESSGRHALSKQFNQEQAQQERTGPDTFAGHSPLKESIMANTLVGVYDTSSQAQSAYNELIADGFERDHLQLSTAESGGVTSGVTSESTQRSAQGEDEGFGASVRHFFSRMFGGEGRDEDTDKYAEAVRRGHALLTVDADNDAKSAQALQIMNRFNPIDIDERAAHWRSSGWSQYDASAPHLNEREIEEDRHQYARGGSTEGATIPVIEEELQVGKREVQGGGVRIYQRVHDTPVEESVQLREEHVNVERRPVDHAATEADLAGLQEGAFEVRESAEEAVVNKTARLVEEVVVSKEATEHTEKISDTVRRTDVEVEQLGAAGGDDEYRRHFQSAYGTSGDRYEDYAQAYRYGSTLAADERYRGYRWNDAEPKVRQDWENQYGNRTPWEKAKDAVRYGWEKVTPR